eukprot:TRINITY_DN3959_c0_g1_i2.p1 TRINITY_DN3959_c0_g1~~TRINITY_DN3959_c0_g1_i2.p1  ORF type:complete len:1321 (-),score=144.62 TRINITY_DN3959_c0_g1_i2:329-4291(-)
MRTQSTKDLLNWVNNLLELNLQGLNELANGAVFCQILDSFFPNEADVKHINYFAADETASVKNFKILQKYFRRSKIQRNVGDISLLTNGNKSQLLDLLKYLREFVRKEQRIYSKSTNSQGRPKVDPKQRRSLTMYGGSDVLPQRILSKLEQQFRACTKPAIENQQTYLNLADWDGETDNKEQLPPLSFQKPRPDSAPAAMSQSGKSAQQQVRNSISESVSSIQGGDLHFVPPHEVDRFSVSEPASPREPRTGALPQDYPFSHPVPFGSEPSQKIKNDHQHKKREVSIDSNTTKGNKIQLSGIRPPRKLQLALEEGSQNESMQIQIEFQEQTAASQNESSPIFQTQVKPQSQNQKVPEQQINVQEVSPTPSPIPIPNAAIPSPMLFAGDLKIPQQVLNIDNNVSLQSNSLNPVNPNEDIEKNYETSEYREKLETPDSVVNDLDMSLQNNQQQSVYYDTESFEAQDVDKSQSEQQSIISQSINQYISELEQKLQDNGSNPGLENSPTSTFNLATPYMDPENEDLNDTSNFDSQQSLGQQTAQPNTDLFSQSCLQFMTEAQLNVKEGAQDGEDNPTQTFLQTRDFMDEYAFSEDASQRKFPQSPTAESQELSIDRLKLLNTAQLVFEIEGENSQQLSGNASATLKHMCPVNDSKSQANEIESGSELIVQDQTLQIKLVQQGQQEQSTNESTQAKQGSNIDEESRNEQTVVMHQSEGQSEREMEMKVEMYEAVQFAPQGQPYPKQDTENISFADSFDSEGSPAPSDSPENDSFVFNNQAPAQKENSSEAQNSDDQRGSSSSKSSQKKYMNGSDGRSALDVVKETCTMTETALKLFSDGMEEFEHHARKLVSGKKATATVNISSERYKVVRMIGNNFLMISCQTLVLLYTVQTSLKRIIQDPLQTNYATQIPSYIEQIKSVIKKCRVGLADMASYEQQSPKYSGSTDKSPRRTNDSLLVRMELLHKKIQRVYLHVKGLDPDNKILLKSRKRLMSVTSVQDYVNLDSAKNVFSVADCSLRKKESGQIASMYRKEYGLSSQSSSGPLGKKHGDGYYSFKNGDEYKGEFVSDRMEGYGVYSFSAGGQYSGEWRQSIYEGVGAETFARGSRYEGQYQNGLRHGYGTCEYYNGDKYIGQWFGGSRQGMGFQNCEDGSRYYGQYKDGKRQGLGVYTFANGDRYMGQYDNDLPHGFGVYEFASGYKYQGEWQHGEKQGWCEYFVSSGEGVVALFKGNKRQWMVDPNHDSLSHEDNKRVQLSKKQSATALKVKEEALQFEYNLTDRKGDFWKRVSHIRSKVIDVDRQSSEASRRSMYLYNNLQLTQEILGLQF